MLHDYPSGFGSGLDWVYVQGFLYYASDYYAFDYALGYVSAFDYAFGVDSDFGWRGAVFLR